MINHVVPDGGHEEKEEEEGGIGQGGQSAVCSAVCLREWLEDTLYSRV